MNNYYICGIDAAGKYCNGYRIKEVHYTTGTTDTSIYSGHAPESLYWHNVILLENVDDDMRLLLSLADNTFRKVASHDISYSVILAEWSTFYGLCNK